MPEDLHTPEKAFNRLKKNRWHDYKIKLKKEN